MRLFTSIVLFVGVFFFLPTYGVTKTADSHVEDRTEEITEDVKPVKNSIIEMQVADWCGPCKAFKRSGAISAMKAKGWSFVEAD